MWKAELYILFLSVLNSPYLVFITVLHGHHPWSRVKHCYLLFSSVFLFLNGVSLAFPF